MYFDLLHHCSRDAEVQFRLASAHEWLLRNLRPALANVMAQAAPMLNGLRLKISLAFDATPRFLWRKFQTQTVFQTKGMQDTRMDNVVSATRRVSIDRSG